MLNVTRLRTRPLILGILVVLVCLLTGAQANAQEKDLFDAAQAGDLQRVKALLDAKVDVNAKNNNGGRALMFASANGHLDVVQVLLAKGAEVNAKDNDGDTALIMASGIGHTDVVQ